jgi:protein-disulfide isomerase
MSKGILTPPAGAEDHAQGPETAPVTLVEYGDYECPHCARAHPIVQQVQRDLGDVVRFVFRNFPLREAHPHAEHAAEAAESVAVHGGEAAFWDMHDLMFENQEALEDSALVAYGGSLGVDETALADDLVSGALADRVNKDFRSGIRSGVNGTPTFFVNGVRYDGDWSDPDVFATRLRLLARTPMRR